MKKIFVVFVCVLLIATICGASCSVLAKKGGGGGKPGGGGDKPAADPAIAYKDMNGGDICVVNADGSNNAKIVEPYSEDDHAKIPFNPSWSPDGKHITYMLDESQFTNMFSICCVDVNIIDGVPVGTNHVRLATDLWGIQGSNPEWSPAGDVIAFMAIYPKGSVRSLWLVNADRTGTPTKILTPNVDTEIKHPAWNPDGTEIAFIENAPATGGGREYSIKILNLETSVIRTVHGPTTDYSIGQNLDWSRDGTKFAFIVYPPPSGGSGNSLYTLDIATNNLAFVDGSQDDSGVSGCPTWSPDDSHIAYMSSGSGGKGKSNLMSIELSTGDLTKIVRNSAFTPDWRRPTDTWPA
jgi:Tol biopolymer transport system component